MRLKPAPAHWIYAVGKQCIAGDPVGLSMTGVAHGLQVSGEERLLGPSRASQGVPLTICSLEKAVRTPGQLAALMERHR